MFVDLISRRVRICPLLAFLLVSTTAASLWGQFAVSNPVQFRVEGPSQRLEMVANSSRILTLDQEIPRALVNNTEVVRVIPLSPNQVQVSALQPGVTQVNLWDEAGDVHSVDVVVYGDARQLEMLIRSEFPHAALRVRPLESSVVLSGYVDRPEIVSRIIRLAEDYYPKVINNITVGGVQQVALHVKVMEVSRTKLRELGIDWAVFTESGGFGFQTLNKMLASDQDNPVPALVSTNAQTVAFGLVDPSNTSFYTFLDALRQNNLVKVLAEPTLITVSGRPAQFKSGGEFPFLVPQSLGTTTIEWKKFGTQVDFVPIVLGNGNIRLEVRPEVSELDETRGATLLDGTRVPGIRNRYADTAAELRAGQTLAIAGLLQTTVESELRGLPWLSDLPWVGAAFRRIKEKKNDIELLILVTPELVDAMESHEVPCVGPGESTASPNDVELYMRGYLEVPQCCPDNRCQDARNGLNPGAGAAPAGVMVTPPAPVVSPSGPAYSAAPNSGYRSVPSAPRSPAGAAWRGASGRASQRGQYLQGSNASRGYGPVQRSTYRTQQVAAPPRVPENNRFTSPNRSASAGRDVHRGLFGPSGYDKLD